MISTPIIAITVLSAVIPAGIWHKVVKRSKNRLSEN